MMNKVRIVIASGMEVGFYWEKLEGTFWSDRGLSLRICQNSLNVTLKICAFYLLKKFN